MKKLLAILLIIFVLAPCSYAENNYSDGFRDSVKTENSLLSEDVDLNDPESIKKDLSPKHFLDFFADQFKSGLKNALKILITGFSLLMLSVLVTRCSSTLQNQNFQYLFSFIMSISMVMICHDGLSSCAAALQKAIEDMQIFTAACIPSFTVVMLSAGEGGGASIFSGAMVLLGEAGALLSNQVMMPLIDVYLTIGICAIIGDEYSFSTIAKQIKRFVFWFIGSGIAIFRLILKLQGGVAAAGDRLTQKAIRTAVGSMIPGVGNTLSQGVDGLFAVASGVKISFAVAAVLIVLSIMSPVLIEILAYGIGWSICRWAADFMNDSAVRAISDVLANGFYIMLAIGGFVALMGLFSFFGIMVQVG